MSRLESRREILASKVVHPGKLLLHWLLNLHKAKEGGDAWETLSKLLN